MTVDILALMAFVAVIQWRHAKRLERQVASLDLRLRTMQQEHNALMTVLEEFDDETTPTDPRSLS